jgi:hypothetical protein
MHWCFWFAPYIIPRMLNTYACELPGEHTCLSMLQPYQCCSKAKQQPPYHSSIGLREEGLRIFSPSSPSLSSQRYA